MFISGAFSSYSYDIEEYSHNLSKNLSASLLGNDYRIVNGIGRRFGTHLIGYANEYLVKEGVKNIEKHLIIRPFVGLGSESQKEKRCLREKIIGKCGAAIFVLVIIIKIWMLQRVEYGKNLKLHVNSIKLLYQFHILVQYLKKYGKRLIPI